MKKSFAIAALCIPALTAMADTGHDFHYTVAPDVTPLNPLPLNVTLTVKDAQVKQFASMEAQGRRVWSETVITPCEKFAARANNHAHGLENVLGIMEVRSEDRGEAARNLATLGSYDGGMVAEQAAMDACQKSESPSPIKTYKAASTAISEARLHLKAVQVLLQP